MDEIRLIVYASHAMAGCDLIHRSKQLMAISKQMGKHFFCEVLSLWKQPPGLKIPIILVPMLVCFTQSPKLEYHSVHRIIRVWKLSFEITSFLQNKTEVCEEI
jgi:hypothetical protein